MDKETLSNYGWIVICVLVLAVMIALAGPFGNFVADAVKSTAQGLFDTNQSALDAAGIVIDNQTIDKKEEIFVKEKNTFAISNYYEYCLECHCYDESHGGLQYVMHEIFSAQGLDMFNGVKKWEPFLDCINEYGEELKNHLHGNVDMFKYKYTEGMTWGDFINSADNGNDFALDARNAVYCNIQGVNYGHYIGLDNTTKVYANDLIDKEIMYAIGYWSIS